MKAWTLLGFFGLESREAAKKQVRTSSETTNRYILDKVGRIEKHAI